ncbi:MAG: Hpt domain-containing protein [Desulfosarcinaceae bacterium]|nr:Hpt domain-containing protein [Desulfosarcinaceae bacterium]
MDFKAMGANLGLEADEFRELVELFMETGKADFDNLRQALSGGDTAAAARYAHTLAGASGNLGLMELHTAAKQIEAAANADQVTAANAQAAEMTAMFDAIAAFVGD